MGSRLIIIRIGIIEEWMIMGNRIIKNIFRWMIVRNERIEWVIRIWIVEGYRE